MPKILIIEDDTAYCQMLCNFLTKHNYSVATSYTLDDARGKLNTSNFDIILSDVRLPGGTGLSLLSRVKEQSPRTQVILMTGYAEVKTAVNAMKNGAFDYISKPFTPDEILAVISKALQTSTLDGAQVTNIKNQNIPDKKSPESFLIGESERSIQLQQYIDLVAPTNMSVLLTGESGTGKEVTARAIHNASTRKDHNFVAVDCGAIPKEIATSEFFGHVKGSFTGAIEDKRGHFETANGGTLFLDEVGNLTYEHQVQLLRAIQERKIKRVGSNKEISLDLRIIAATNENLAEAMEEGRFREDLYHRLNEFTIEVPSVQERAADIMLFANYFLKKANEELGKSVAGFSEEAREILYSHSWPGNFREMKNVIKRAVLFSEGDILKPESFPVEVLNGHKKRDASKFSKEEYEKERILDALKQTNLNKSEAAKLLKITRKTLYNKINRYQLEV